jgi:hypothetical protein
MLTNDLLGKALREGDAFNKTCPYHTSSCNIQYILLQLKLKKVRTPLCNQKCYMAWLLALT